MVKIPRDSKGRFVKGHTAWWLTTGSENPIKYHTYSKERNKKISAVGDVNAPAISTAAIRGWLE